MEITGAEHALMVSPWSTCRSAPAGSSVSAVGRTTANGTPLARTTFSPCSPRERFRKSWINRSAAEANASHERNRVS